MEDFEKYINRNKNINRGYRKLIVWQESIQLFAFIKKKLNEIKTISFKVKAQIEDSGFSVSSNIAEGYSRRYIKETLQYNSISMALLAENYSQFFALLVSNDIDQKWFDEYDNRHYSLENKLIKYNQSIVDRIRNKGEWRTDYRIADIIEPYLTRDME